MRKIALNFLPLATDQFSFVLYRIPYAEGLNRPSAGDEQAIRRNLPDNDDRRFYWTTFGNITGSTRVRCKPYDNNYATLDALRLALISQCEKQFSENEFHIISGIRDHLEIVIQSYDEGHQAISLEPYLLRSQGKFGFLADFRFHPKEEYRGTRKSLELSLALDSNGQQNRNYYVDRHNQLVQFVEKFHNKIFPLTMPGDDKIDVETSLVDVAQEQLDVKQYIAGTHSEHRSQFMGIKENGPLEKASDDSLLYFVHQEKDIPLSRELYRALRGDTFRTFPGFERMFGLRLSRDNVKGIAIKNFNQDEIERLRDKISEDIGNRKVVPVVLTPFSRHDQEQNNEAYWHLKYAFLSKNLPIQVVSTETIAERNKLKWSTASIGLQIFAKLGGTPWKVRLRNARCLIVGIGQAHQILDDGRIGRYFAYSVLTDSSGVFKEVRVMGESGSEDQYLSEFESSLRSILTEYSSDFSTFAVHSTFSVRKQELECIARIFNEKQRKDNKTGEFVALKFNDRNRFFGFSLSQNSLVPYESTIVSLSDKEYLVWFEGLQYNQPNVKQMIGGPLHVKFIYPDVLTNNMKQSYLQDAINLSGANWRGFNAKSLPVSVYYAQIIAKYLKEFEKRQFPPIDVGIVPPWFL